MRRRRKEVAGGHGEPPAWLITFTAADWLPKVAAIGLGATEDEPMDRVTTARRRWEAAGRAWLDERGHEPTEWYRITRPGPVVDRGPDQRRAP